MLRRRRVKIVVTLGPASQTLESIRSLFIAGADVFRINMSYTTHEQLHVTVGHIRRVESEMKRSIGIIADLQGTKLRIGSLETGVASIISDTIFILDNNPDPGNSSRVYLPHHEVILSVEPGHRLLLDDGKITLHCIERHDDKLITIAKNSGAISNYKGVNLPDTPQLANVVTDKDNLDIQAALSNYVDWIAISFIQKPSDLRQIHEITKGKVGIIAKIEKSTALSELSGIIQEADAIMVARGDLGVELQSARVPGIQKRIVQACRKHGKPVIVATHMLESMVSSQTPTRAEVADISGAVFEGVDAIMLSAESAVGKNPVKAVQVMNEIAETTEKDQLYPELIYTQQYSKNETTVLYAVARAAKQISDTLQVAAIICCTSSSITCSQISRERPMSFVVWVSPDSTNVSRHTLTWGVYPVQDESNFLMIDRCSIDKWAWDISRKVNCVIDGDKLVLITEGAPGACNLSNILYIVDARTDNVCLSQKQVVSDTTPSVL